MPSRERTENMPRIYYSVPHEWEVELNKRRIIVEKLDENKDWKNAWLQLRMKGLKKYT